MPNQNTVFIFNQRQKEEQQQREERKNKNSRKVEKRRKNPFTQHIVMWGNNPVDVLLINQKFVFNKMKNDGSEMKKDTFKKKRRRRKVE